MVRVDVGTLAFASGMLALALAPIFALIAGRRGLGRSQRLFAAAAGAYGLGVLPIILWPTVPAALLAGNLIVMGSACAAHAGVAAHLGRRPAWRACAAGAAVVGGGFALSLHAGLGGVSDRIILISALRIPFLVHAAMMARGQSRRSSRVLLVGFSFFAGLLALRILDLVVGGYPISDFVGTVGMQAVYFTGASAFLVLLGISSILAAAETEEAYLRERIDAQTVALREAKEVAEQALAAKSAFLAAASHDLRQAVHAMTMHLSAVSEELADAPEGYSGLSGLTGDMTRVVATMADQLNALVEIARLDSGRIAPRMRPIPLDDLFTRLEGQYGHVARANEVDLRFVASSVAVLSDRTLLLRLLGNLIDNAIKHGAGGRVLVGCRRRGSTAAVLVCDEGGGIASGHIDAIFGTGPRPAETLDRQESGTGGGLGLTIVKRTSDLLGHRLEVRSERGHGTVFCVSLPVSFQAQLDVSIPTACGNP